MIDRKSDKKCNPERLTKELIELGWVRFDELRPDEPFNFYGVSWDGKQTIVHLRDGETLDPTPIVEAHLYEEPKIPKPISIERVVAKLIEAGIIGSREEVEERTHTGRD